MNEEQIEELVESLLRALRSFSATLEEWDMVRAEFTMVIRDRT
jgi:hypothetical protein